MVHSILAGQICMQAGSVNVSGQAWLLCLVLGWIVCNQLQALSCLAGSDQSPD